MVRGKTAKGGYKAKQSATAEEVEVQDSVPAATTTESSSASQMETKQDGGCSSDSTMELKKALADIETSDLLEMAKRLHKSYEQMTEFVQESEKESEELKKDNQRLHEAIDTWAKETRKLNISSDNLVDPDVDEGPLDFVGRYWEQLRPRNNQVLLNEHVGDLKRNQHQVPGALDNAIVEVTTKVGELQAQAAEAATQAAEAADFDNIKTEAQAKIADLKEKVAYLDSDIKAQAADLREKVESFNESFREKSLSSLSGITEKIGTLDDFNAQASTFKENSLANLSAHAESLNTHAASLKEKSLEGLNGLTEKVGGLSAESLNTHAASLKEKSLEGLNGLTEKVGGLSALWGGISQHNVDQDEEEYVSDEEGSAEEKMLRRHSQKGTSSAILNSATPLSKDKRGMDPQSGPSETTKAEGKVDADTFQWLTHPTSGIKEKFTIFEDIKTQAAGLKEKVKTFDTDGFRETSMGTFNELKAKSIGGWADMTTSMGFGGLSTMFGGSTATFQREEQASSSDSTPNQAFAWEQSGQNAAERPASRQAVMCKEDDAPALNPSSLTSPKTEIPQEIQDACALEDQVVSSTEVSNKCPGQSVQEEKEEEEKKEEEQDEEEEEEEDEVSSSVLIEANLTLDDGSVEVLRLRAIDRSVDVAAKFLRDHNLKEQQFKEPLTAWLKSVESSAETFPVKAKGDLFQIRQEFSKNKQEKSGASSSSLDGSDAFA